MSGGLVSALLVVLLSNWRARQWTMLAAPGREGSPSARDRRQLADKWPLACRRALWAGARLNLNSAASSPPPASDSWEKTPGARNGPRGRLSERAPRLFGAPLRHAGNGAAAAP